MCQGEDAEPVEDAGSVRDGGKQPFKVVLVNALREERDNSEKHSGIRPSEKSGERERARSIFGELGQKLGEQERARPMAGGLGRNVARSRGIDLGRATQI